MRQWLAHEHFSEAVNAALALGIELAVKQDVVKDGKKIRRLSNVVVEWIQADIFQSLPIRIDAAIK